MDGVHQHRCVNCGDTFFHEHGEYDGVNVSIKHRCCSYCQWRNTGKVGRHGEAK